MPGIWMEHFLVPFFPNQTCQVLLGVAPGGVVYTFVWSTMLEHVFKVPLAFIQRTLKPLLFGRTREMPLLA